LGHFREKKKTGNLITAKATAKFIPNFLMAKFQKNEKSM